MNNEELLKEFHINTGTLIAKEYFGLEVYPTQAEIIGVCINEHIERVGIITPSRYGKSFNIGASALFLAAIEGKEVSIASGDKEKASIVQDKVIKHLKTSCKDIISQLQHDTQIEKLNIQASKNGLMFKNGGSIKIFSLSESIKNEDIGGKGFIGFGGDVLIIDESALISDKNYSTALRILTEKKDARIIEISNPHQKNHFYKLMHNPNAYKIWINAKDAIKEAEENKLSTFESGLTENLLENLKEEMTIRDYKVYYDCVFPDAKKDDVFFADAPFQVLENMVIADYAVFAGLDCAYTGDDQISLTLVAYDRANNNYYGYSRYRFKENNEDGEKIEEISSKIITILKANSCLMLAVDEGGVGVGLLSWLKRQSDFLVLPVNFGSKPTQERKDLDDPIAIQAFNKRAEMHLDIKKLNQNKNLFITKEINEELEKITNYLFYEVRNGKYLIQNKQALKKSIGKSPDDLDSLILAIHATIIFYMNEEVDNEIELGENINDVIDYNEF